MVVDGHARIEDAISAAAAVIPVIHIEISEAEERLMLATFDPISAMAKFDQERLDDLIASIDTDNPALNDLLASLSGEDIDGAPIVAPAPVKESKTLVLIYDDPDDYAELVGALSLLPGPNPAEKILRLVRNTLG